MQTIGDLASRRDFKAASLHVSPARRWLEGPVGTSHLQPIEMKVFLLLLEARGDVVTRDELFASVWGGVFVGDESLNRAIARVRKVLTETALGDLDIETIPRTGYRLAGTIVEQLRDEDSIVPYASRVDSLTRRQIVTGGVIIASAAAGAGLWLRERAESDRVVDDLLDRGGAALRRDTAEDAQQSIELLERAVARRPNSARAWGLLACAYAVWSSYAPSPKSSDVLAAAKRAARKSLQIEAGEPDAEAALVSLEGSLQARASSDARLREILRRDPRNGYVSDALVGLLQSAGYTRESWALNQRALAIDPFAPVPLYRRALKLWIMGRVAEANELIGRTRELWPSHPAVWNARLLILAFTGRAPAALALLDDRETLPNTLTPAAASVWRTALPALDMPNNSNIAAARATVLDAAGVSPGLAAYGAMIMSALGDADSAYRVIEGFLLSKGTIAMRADTGSKQVLVNYPGWRETQWLFVPPTAAVRNDPRFGRLAEEIGLAGYWRARGARPDYQLVPS